MRLLIHDYGRFPFIFQLARKLAERSVQVCYVYSAAVPERASLTDAPNKPPGLEVVAIPVAGPLAKIDFVKRRKQEIAHGKALCEVAARFRPDVVVSANTPLDPQTALQRWCRHNGVRFVYWLQDLYGLAIRELLRQKLPVVGAPIAWHYMRMERRLIARSDLVVAITDDFRPHVARMGASNGSVHILENWAPLEEVPVRPKDNPWSRRHGLHDKRVILYSGTMGMKHDPKLLIDLAASIKHEPDARVVVVSVGSAIGLLKEQVDKRGLSNLIVMPLQPQEDLPDVLGTADVLVAILEGAAGVFSVPSKVLTYLCAGRAILLGVPKENLAARMVSDNAAGIVVAPDRVGTFVEAADCLLHETEFREFCAVNARRYAEIHFNIETIADSFERIVGCSQGKGVVHVVEAPAPAPPPEPASPVRRA